MYVVDVEEVQLGTRVYVFALVAAAVDDVHHGVHLGSCVHDEDAVRLRVGVHHGLHVVLVGAGAVGGDADQRLRAPENDTYLIGEFKFSRPKSNRHFIVENSKFRESNVLLPSVFS